MALESANGNPGSGPNIAIPTRHTRHTRASLSRLLTDLVRVPEQLDNTQRDKTLQELRDLRQELNTRPAVE